ncbi:iron-sulfur cluster assembly accessory protein [Microcoleus sp. FACHB-SPT15]|uniref:HesB/IscA family protein n=1 Tax=Microcoleus sp. FACHB-SPT15 TaxID=2692830 RepID=UPI0017848D6A|nr:iron-sulfur cluster assembly accessory protein [Microcoleus sp. FACHB-SPT15]MBD1809933.1 iron-sulfur cluster assembly accessory protein [Microcoleus sp. FACHB-SPT15]
MINISKAALAEIRRLQARRHNPEAILRLGVQRGGCAGLYYTIDFDKKLANSSDRVFDCDGISVTVDADSLQYITGLTLDYSEDLMGGGFRFHNPNALESCGCGNSFRVST